MDSYSCVLWYRLLFFFFKDPATTEIYTLSLHDALPILGQRARAAPRPERGVRAAPAEPRGAAGRDPRGGAGRGGGGDRKSTRLNSSHSQISYAVFCLKKKKL